MRNLNGRGARGAAARLVKLNHFRHQQIGRSRHAEYVGIGGNRVEDRLLRDFARLVGNVIDRDFEQGVLDGLE